MTVSALLAFLPVPDSANTLMLLASAVLLVGFFAARAGRARRSAA